MATKDLTFKQSLTRLEEIVEKLETQDLDLEEAIALLSEGMALHQKCQDKLKRAKVQIDKIMVEDSEATVSES